MSCWTELQNPFCSSDPDTEIGRRKNKPLIGGKGCQHDELAFLIKQMRTLAQPRATLGKDTPIENHHVQPLAASRADKALITCVSAL